MPRDPVTSDEQAPPRSGWRWSDDILLFRIKFVAGMAVVGVIVLAGYLAVQR